MKKVDILKNSYGTGSKKKRKINPESKPSNLYRIWFELKEKLI